MISPEQLIGKRSDDESFVEAMASLNEVASTDRFADLEIMDFPRSGVSVYLNDCGEVVSVFLFGSDDEEHAPYMGPMPFGLEFGDDTAAVTRKLGSPSKSGVEKTTGLRFYRFDSERLLVHVQFASDGKSIRMITMMSPSYVS